MRTALTLLSIGLLAAVPACGDDDDKKNDTTTTTDTSATDTTATETSATETVDETTDDDADTADAPDGSTEPLPDYFPAATTAADETLTLPGLTDPVRVVYDDRGIPHIYGKNELDLLAVQGYVTARDRLFQMHTLRSASKGRLAEFAGNNNLSGDFFLRLLELGRTAEAMADWTEQNDPLVWNAIEAFTRGVNHYIARMRAGEVPRPIEVSLFGDSIVYDWSADDTMAIVRLQTWDLGFGGVSDELTLWTQMESLRDKFAGTARDGVWLDLANFEPTAETATLEPEGGASQVPTFSLAQALADDFYGFDPQKLLWALEVQKGFEALDQIPHRAFRGRDGDVWGSNNWVIAGAHTASGKPIVSNDTHLSLRNPAIFYQVHLSNTLAGGDFNSQGVIFAGAPGIVLGHNDHAAWGGTVFYSDVTDTYVETLDATMSTVLYDGQQVALDKRVEVFRFAGLGDGDCVDTAPAWVKNLEYVSEKLDGRCTLTVTFLDVPHHGPIIPWSIAENDDGTFRAMSFKWTGFEPTDELGAVYRLNTVASFDGFKSALDRFGVGAQNWIYGDTAGDIGWYPSHLIPIRKHIAAGDHDYPPFLPMPGHTSDTNWDGFVPRSAIPQAHNPAKGFLVTANADPIGVSFDNDPFNDGGPYIGYAWDVGYRADQITQRVEELIASDTPITREHLKAIQADHKSRLGQDLVPVILEALDAATSGADATAAPFATEAVIAACGLLAKWGTDYDYQAESGVGAADGSAEAEAAAATSIFNAFLPFFIQNGLADEGLHTTTFSLLGRLLKRLFVKPETMASYDEVNGVSPLWDDTRTDEVVETRAFIIMKSLAEAIAFLSDPTKIGPRNAGGFGTADMTKWRWGALHTVTLKHNVSSTFDIPGPLSAHPNGFERHGDNFVVDASNPGLTDTTFTFGGGAAIRNHYEMKETVEFDGVIPGGQSEDPNSPHYADEAEHWARNLSPKVAFTVEDVVAAKRRIVDFKAP
ncbi:MAG: penicillin acylase family protein [Deltaproteobacteria bacterium]|nr:penicillin acylase family protein [Deltaproteobacteria bacterium]